MFGSRTNTLEINIENRQRENKNTKCNLCGKEDETTIHFILECEKLEDKRNKKLIRKYTQKEKEDTLAKILFGKDDTEEIIYMLENIWRKRTRIKINNEEKEKENTENRNTRKLRIINRKKCKEKPIGNKRKDKNGKMTGEEG